MRRISAGAGRLLVWNLVISLLIHMAIKLKLTHRPLCVQPLALSGSMPTSSLFSELGSKTTEGDSDVAFRDSIAFQLHLPPCDPYDDGAILKKLNSQRSGNLCFGENDCLFLPDASIYCKAFGLNLMNLVMSGCRRRICIVTQWADIGWDQAFATTWPTP